MNNEQNDKVKQMFLQARRFKNAGAVLADKWSETDDIDLYVAPFIVNSSFAIELYLKCIYMIENGKEPNRVHKLDLLYKKLSRESKDSIAAIFMLVNERSGSYHALKDKVPGFDWSIEGVLASASQAFVNWRYSFEGNLTSFSSPQSIFIALESCIFMLREDLNNEPQPIVP